MSILSLFKRGIYSMRSRKMDSPAMRNSGLRAWLAMFGKAGRFKMISNSSGTEMVTASVSGRVVAADVFLAHMVLRDQNHDVILGI